MICCLTLSLKKLLTSLKNLSRKIHNFDAMLHKVRNKVLIIIAESTNADFSKFILSSYFLYSELTFRGKKCNFGKKKKKNFLKSYFKICKSFSLWNYIFSPTFNSMCYVSTVLATVNCQQDPPNSLLEKIADLALFSTLKAVSLFYQKLKSKNI